MTEPTLSAAFNDARIAYREFRRFADGALPILKAIASTNLLEFSGAIDRMRNKSKILTAFETIT